MDARVLLRVSRRLRLRLLPPSTALAIRIPPFESALRAPRASYHSYDHPSPPPYSETTRSILSASLAHVPEHGFTQEALRHGARASGYLSVSTNLFPQGVFDLILYYLASQRIALHATVNADSGFAKSWAENKTGIGARVTGLLKHRLRMNEEAGVVSRWPEALAIMAQPTHVSQSLAELGRLSDDIWFLAGDTSVDTSWYTKRASLTAIYAAAEVYQTQDTSIARLDTDNFVDSRLSELYSARLGFDSVAEWLGFTAHTFVNLLRSKGIRI